MDEKEKDETTLKKKGRPAKKLTFGVEEIQDKLARSFNAIAFFLKVEKTYKDRDFEEEAKDIVRLAEKYPVLSDILVFLDPLFLLLGLFSKAKEMMEMWGKKRKQLQEEKAAQQKGDEDGYDYPAHTR